IFRARFLPVAAPAGGIRITRNISILVRKKNGEVAAPSGGENGRPHCLAEVHESCKNSFVFDYFTISKNHKKVNNKPFKKQEFLYKETSSDNYGFSSGYVKKTILR
ncbi:MAG: hypothetical protein KAR47_06195, partial [Planctomycetes bacterium]|nr:hypothetical protein [Planctomycetota bacterium]